MSGMPTMLSLWEMRTHGQAALRVLGVPFGASERAMELLVWSHAVDGGAVEFLVEHEDRIRAGADAVLTVVEESSRSIVLDAHGQSLLTAGAAAVDLAVAFAVSEGSGSVVVGNAFGDRFAPALAWWGATRDVVTRVTTATGGWWADGDGLHPCDERSSGLEVVAGDSSRGPEGPVIEVAERLAAAQRHGHPTEPAAAQRFLELGHRLWLPTSARSRAQGSEGDQS